MPELIWVFSPKPKIMGQNWEWPMALYAGPTGKHAAYVISELQYQPSGIATRFQPLGVLILKHKSIGAPRRMLADTRFLQLRDAIQFTENFIQTHRDWHPMII